MAKSIKGTNPAELIQIKRDAEMFSAFFAYDEKERLHKVHQQIVEDLQFFSAHGDVTEFEDALNPEKMAIRSTLEYRQTLHSVLMGNQMGYAKVLVGKHIAEGDYEKAKQLVSVLKDLASIDSKAGGPTIAVQINNTPPEGATSLQHLLLNE